MNAAPAPAPLDPLTITLAHIIDQAKVFKSAGLGAGFGSLGGQFKHFLNH